jgi:hypothetical protein
MTSAALVSAIALGACVLSTGTAHASDAPAIVGVTSAADGGGWTVTSSGSVGAFGGAALYGSEAGASLNNPIVGIASTPDGHGYWLVASDGGIFSFGDAAFHGSTGSLHLNKPIVGMASTSDGGGYWLVASDGGIFSFGDAAFHGSTGSLHLNKPIVGMASTSDGGGYWLVASDGGIFSFGDASFHGSTGEMALAQPVIGMAASKNTGGYWLVGADGGIFSFDAPYMGRISGPASGIVADNGGGYDEVSPTGQTSIFSPSTAGNNGANPSPQQATQSSPSSAGGPNPSPQQAAQSSPSSAGGPNPPASQTTSSNFPLSIFSQPVLSQPVSPNSATYVTNLVQQYEDNYGSIGVNQMPVFTVPATQPTVTVTVRNGCGDFLPNTGSQIPIPAGAYTTDPNYQHDSDIVIEQPSTGKVWELWQAANNGNGTWSACWGGKLDSATSSGVFPDPYGLSATGISYAATMITESDVASGQIDHAIAMQVVDCDGSTAPANRGDCGSDSGQPPEGTWFRLPATLVMPTGLTPYAQMVFRALQVYGAVVVDQAGAVMVQSETSADWTNEGHSGVDPITQSWAGRPEYAALSGIPWANLQVIAPPAE